MKLNIDTTILHKSTEWLEQQLFLENKISTQPRTVRRGQVYICNFNGGVGSEIYKTRPCVILQNNNLGRNSRITIIAPLTHTCKTISCCIPLSTNVNPNDPKPSYVNIGFIRAIDKVRLGGYLGKLPEADMQKIDKAMAEQLGIYKYYDKLKHQMENDLTQENNSN